jgi:hypothetical protein
MSKISLFEALIRIQEALLKEIQETDWRSTGTLVVNDRQSRGSELKFIGGHLPRCPVKEAAKRNGTYYRILVDGQLTADGFRSRAELFKHGVLKKHIDTNKCEEYAVSLFRSIEDAKEGISLFKRHFRNAKIARVDITEGHGVIHEDKPNHANWWHIVDFNPLEISQVILDEDKN